MLNTLVHWFISRQGKVSYSMDYRNGPYSYDCSSAVYTALIAAGFLPKGTTLGNTDSLYRLEGSLLIPIKRSDIRFGDLFVSGRKGASGGSAGHTGIALSKYEIIHCTYSRNGIARTPIDGWTAAPGQPTHWYRLRIPAHKAAATLQPKFTLGQKVKIAPNFKRWQTGQVANYNVIGEVDQIIQIRKIRGRYSYLLKRLYSWIWEDNLSATKG